MPTTPAVEVTLDGRPVELPKWVGVSVDAIQTFLDGVALANRRVVWTLEVDGEKCELERTLPAAAFDGFTQLDATSIDFVEFRQMMLSTGEGQAERLQTALHAGVLSIMINDAAACCQLWQDWEAKLGAPLVSLRAIEELKLEGPEGAFMERPLSRHAEDLLVIRTNAQGLFLTDAEGALTVDNLAFSELIEQQVLPWLAKTAEYFKALGESTLESIC